MENHIGSRTPERMLFGVTPVEGGPSEILMMLAQTHAVYIPRTLCLFHRKLVFGTTGSMANGNLVRVWLALAFKIDPNCSEVIIDYKACLIVYNSNHVGPKKLFFPF